MLIPLTVDASATLPAASTHVPVFASDWLAPSADTVPPATESVAFPEPPASSAQEKLTTTLVLFQPKPFADGVRLPLITGFAVSTAKSLCDSRFPPKLVQALGAPLLSTARACQW